VETIDRDLPLFPLGRVVLFPGMPLRLNVFEPRYRAMMAVCEGSDKTFGVLLIRSGREVGPAALPERVGCTARITELTRLADGRMNVLAVGDQRFRMLEDPEETQDGYLVARSRIVIAESFPDLDAQLVPRVRSLFRSYEKALGEVAREQSVVPSETELGTDPLTISFQVAAALRVRPRERQRLLEEDDPMARLRSEAKLLRRELQTLKLMAVAPKTERTIGPFSAN
jgi:Lon protease-like protein